ncbi:putative Mg2+ transporter-C (MgtC) family protein [Paenibacillus taihuensis]|uniref:Putative Mg2+ transporter-C (MgtC) family protein n=1 Tax=Paenibacillus taihuensis TaxID=1156355 RepID=A0A3D9QTV7_9BACL|nr:MgtC/SapB family protein [Paenibacillus taihuensis]REE66998.1 putative Mg2+ transporter-C (MgtC) family protein [Paenibacillus taihuensis]
MEYGLLLRVVLAGICGAVIGFERKNRMKEAGIRTHFVVAAGAALMMLISKYGFGDMTDKSGIALDPSRIAAQVVSGVGFLGAGMIFMQRHTIKGLTTAAGIWLSAGIGMAIGADLYIMGIGTTILMMIAQKLLHSKIHWLTSPKTEQLSIRMSNENDAVNVVLNFLKEKEITIFTVSYRETRSDIRSGFRYYRQAPPEFRDGTLDHTHPRRPFSDCCRSSIVIERRERPPIPIEGKAVFLIYSTD